MQAPFDIDDKVVCIKRKVNTVNKQVVLEEGTEYTINWTNYEDGQWFVELKEFPNKVFYAERFELVGKHKTPIERKINKLYQRYEARHNAL